MTRIKVVLFDLDDTLISEKEYIKSGYHHISALLGEQLQLDKNAIYQALLHLFHESPENVFNRLLDQYHIHYAAGDIIKLVKSYRSHFPKVTYYNDVIPCLDMLHSINIQTGIITDGFAISQKKKLEAVQAFKYFDKVIVTDELGSDREFWKPHRLPFQMMQENFHTSYDEMIYVGDNPEKDFYIGSVYPIKTVRIVREGIHKNKHYLHDFKENYAIHQLTELDYVLKNLPSVKGGKR